jgi:hypothetical protein
METVDLSKWRPLVEHLQRVFAGRFEALVAYGRDGHVSSLALVQSIDADDLDACARVVSHWHGAGLTTPLLVTTTEFKRSLDAFPLEYAEVQQTAKVVHGYNPFERFGSIKHAELRRACEVQANSHLLHLREDYLDSGARPKAVAAIVCGRWRTSTASRPAARESLASTPPSASGSIPAWLGMCWR